MTLPPAARIAAVQAVVAHDGGDQGLFRQRAVGQHVQGGNRMMSSPSIILPLRRTAHAIGIAVVRNSEVRRMLATFTPSVRCMERSSC